MSFFRFLLATMWKIFVFAKLEGNSIRWLSDEVGKAADEEEFAEKFDLRSFRVFFRTTGSNNSYVNYKNWRLSSFWCSEMLLVNIRNWTELLKVSASTPKFCQFSFSCSGRIYITNLTNVVVDDVQSPWELEILLRSHQKILVRMFLLLLVSQVQCIATLLSK